jgi:hypothetical protein
MRTIVIPAPIPAKDFVTGEPQPIIYPNGKQSDALEFNWWLQHVVLSDLRWSENYKTMRMARNVDRAFQKAEDGAMHVEDAAYELMRQIVENPRHRGPRGWEPGYENNNLARLAFPFVEAVMDAVEAA